MSTYPKEFIQLAEWLFVNFIRVHKIKNINLRCSRDFDKVTEYISQFNFNNIEN